MWGGIGLQERTTTTQLASGAPPLHSNRCRLLNPLAAILISVTAILIFAEIAPQVGFVASCAASQPARILLAVQPHPHTSAATADPSLPRLCFQSPPASVKGMEIGAFCSWLTAAANPSPPCRLPASTGRLQALWAGNRRLLQLAGACPYDHHLPCLLAPGQGKGRVALVLICLRGCSWLVHVRMIITSPVFWPLGKVGTATGCRSLGPLAGSSLMRCCLHCTGT